MIKNKRNRFGMFDAIIYLFMIVVLLVTLYPFWSQVVLSLSEKKDIYRPGLLLFPRSFNLDAYKSMLYYDSIWSGYLWTIYRSVLGTVLSTFFTALLAYPLTKKSMPFNKLFSFMILFTMLFSGGLIPSYLLVTKTLKLTDTIWALVLPGMISAFSVFIVRNYFWTLPQSLEESAKIDGASYFRIFLQIVMPLSMPALATISLWTFVGHWQAWYDCMLYMHDSKKFVLQLVIRKILIVNMYVDAAAAIQRATQGQTLVDERQMRAAVIMISILPMLFVYPFLQKYFVKGIVLGAVKG